MNAFSFWINIHAYVEDKVAVLNIWDCSVCRRQSGSCPTLQLGISSRSKL